MMNSIWILLIQIVQILLAGKYFLVLNDKISDPYYRLIWILLSLIWYTGSTYWLAGHKFN